MEETVTGVTPGRARLCVALLVLMGFALGCSEFIVIGIESNLAKEMGVSLATAGQLISLFALPYAVMTPVLALATGRFRRYSVMLVYLVLFCLGNALSTFAPSFGVLLAARVLLGSVSGALLAVGVTFIPELVGAKRSSGALTLVYASYSVALIVATSVGKILASTVGWHVAMYGALALSLIAGVLLAVFMPRSGQTDEPATAREQARLFGEPSIIAGMLVFVFGIGSVCTFYGYVTPYMEQVLGMDAVAVSGALVVYGVITFGSNLLSGWVDMRFGLKALVVVFLAQAAILAGLYVAGSSMPAALVLVMLVGLVMYVASIPSVSHFMDVARRRYPKALTLASSLEPLSFNVGIAFGTFVGGVVVSGPGIGAVGLVGAVLAVAAAALVGVTLALTKREESRG
ncbi:MFS transporter [Olsenella sp. AM04-33]|uniref:MFS transporter n=1 Tax=Olsenella sp. AM04-33 TaxID=2292049 RepID=UPI000A895DDC|nr:MFS transporter [Olsenella sp. AM04-33]